MKNLILSTYRDHLTEHFVYSRVHKEIVQTSSVNISIFADNITRFLIMIYEIFGSIEYCTIGIYFKIKKNGHLTAIFYMTYTGFDLV